MTRIRIHCPSCDEFYELPYAKKQELRDYFIVYALCPFCHKPRDPEVYKRLETDTMPRCKVCKRPNFNGKELCDAHIMEEWRKKKLQQHTENI